MNNGAQQYRSLVSALNAALVVVDYQKGVASSSGAAKDNELDGVTDLVKVASAFALPVIVATIKTVEMDGQVCGPLLDLVRGSDVIQQSSANPWDDDAFRYKIHTVDHFLVRDLAVIYS